MSISTVTKILNIFMACFIIVFCLCVYMLAKSIYDYMRIEQEQSVALTLAIELRNSSRLLTDNFRLYVMTQNPAYEEEYWRIARERAGIEPRLSARKVAPGKTIPLTALIEKNVKFMEEMGTIKRAHELSDDLIRFEKLAMDMVKGTTEVTQDLEKARKMAFGTYYISKTDEIMSMLNQFYSELDGSVRASSAAYKEKINRYIIFTACVFALFLAAMVFIRIIIYRSVYRPIKIITCFANNIMGGDISRRIEKFQAPKEIEQLCLTLNMMLDKLQNEIVASGTDPLTHCFNRRGFEKMLDEMKLLAAYRRQPISILMLDIDFFKKVNDRFGHHCGDDVLRRFADEMRRCCRKDDIVGRLGGEEFAILMATSLDIAHMLAERIRMTMENSRILPDGTAVTCSIGITTYRMGESDQEFIDRSDKALYRAKQDGRNRVVIIEG